MRATTSHRRGFPCFDDLLFQACRRHYPDGPARCCRCLAQRYRPSPKLSRVGFRHKSFRGRAPPVGWSGVHSRFGLPVRSITQGDFYQSTSTNSLPPSSPWLLPAERPIGRMGFAPTGDRRLARRTEFLTRSSCVIKGVINWVVSYIDELMGPNRFESLPEQVNCCRGLHTPSLHHLEIMVLKC